MYPRRNFNYTSRSRVDVPRHGQREVDEREIKNAGEDGCFL